MQFEYLDEEWKVWELIGFHNLESDYVVLDTETTGLDRFNDTLSAIVISGRSADSACMFHPRFREALLEIRKPLVLHNFKFDYHMLHSANVDLLNHKFYDTMLMHHLADENKDHDLDSVIREEFGDEQGYKELFWDCYKTFDKAPLNEQLEYACKDVIYTGKIYKILKERINNDSLIEHVHRLAKALFKTERAGLKVDLDYTQSMGVTLLTQIQKLKIEMRGLVDYECKSIELRAFLSEVEKRKTDKGKAGVKLEEFNFDSNKQLQELLYQELKLPVQLSKIRKPTTDDKALENLSANHVLIPHLREYRGLQKTYGSFIEGTLERVRQDRVFPTFNVNGTVTGRISSSNPNMQQLPKEGGVRGIYIPDTGMAFVSCDYSQLEVTIAAHFSQDENLLKIVLEGASQHDITAKGLGVPRDKAKTINFAMQYGAGVGKIQKILDCSEKDAELALGLYWQTYAGLKKLIDQCHEKVMQNLPIVNPFGRHRRFPDPKTLGKWELEAAKRQSFNSLVQGTGSDITHEAFYTVSEKMEQFQYGRALFEVHDEILISTKLAACEDAINLLTSEMKQVGKRLNLTVPLSVDCSGPMDRWKKG